MQEQLGAMAYTIVILTADLDAAREELVLLRAKTAEGPRPVPDSPFAAGGA